MTDDDGSVLKPSRLRWEAGPRRHHGRPGHAILTGLDEKARTKWAAGLVVPEHLTAALNLCHLYGPEVDEACHAKEPDVDRWEAGELYPRWDQIVALGKLTGFHPTWFMAPARRRLRVEDTSLRFHLPPDDEPETPPVYTFTSRALAEARRFGVNP